MEQETNAQARLEKARLLVQCLEAGDTTAAEKIIDDLTRLRESALYKEVGRMTRDLHEAIVSFAADTRISELTSDELPDAKDRLNRVIAMTEEAANRTLSAVEDLMPLVRDMGDRSGRLHKDWQKFLAKDMPADRFRTMAQELREFLPHVEANAGKVYDMANDVLMAQNFQDLTGQIIRRVIRLLEEMQEKLLTLLKLSGQRLAEASEKHNALAEGDIGPHILGRESAEAVSSQNEVDDLLSSLGF